MNASTLLRIGARANRLANFRLHAAMAPLSHAELHAPRSSFFPTLMATLNHILGVDLYYVGALHGEQGLAEAWDRFEPAAELSVLAERQRVSDERLIAWCDAQSDAGFVQTIAMPREPGRVQHDAAAHVLQHLLMHQTHHRGQVHTMLTGTAVAPPQLDEFLMPSEPQLRTAEMAALGWDETRVYGLGGGV
ncbi:MAG: DinB family protein [Chitinophagaceae bacterium]|nr:DinB family protein [Rubrivivax sp.]